MKKLLVIVFTFISVTAFSQVRKFNEQYPLKQGNWLESRHPKLLASRAYQRPQVERVNGKIIITMSEQQFRMIQNKSGFSPRPFGRVNENMCPKCRKKHQRHK